jgi:RecA-family ATPase
LERGRQVAFFSEAKAGKSLLWLEISAALCMGREVLGNPPRPPVRVLYIDKENTRKDIRERLSKMGYEGELFENFFYYLFPDISYLDTEQGGRELFALAKFHEVDFVVLDTTSRVVEGSENENDTYHYFYQHTGVRLKADGIGLVRLDHAGKDFARGMRGASSKTTDVDDVWSLTIEDSGNTVVLHRTMTRTNHGDSDVTLSRKDEPHLFHESFPVSSAIEFPAEEDMITA